MKKLLFIILTAFFLLSGSQTANAQSYGDPLSFDDFVSWAGNDNGADIHKLKDATKVMNALSAKGFTRQGKSYRRVKNGNTIDVYVTYQSKSNPGYAIEFSNPQDAINFDKEFRGYREDHGKRSTESYKGTRILSHYCPPKTGSNARSRKGYVMVERINNKVRILCNAKD
ncbi:MAG: hypothetical protein K2N05_03050 [Muribaculaceae bacterium]|nr:hypothetical protein [Muribaculaceae bacterium]